MMVALPDELLLPPELLLVDDAESPASGLLSLSPLTVVSSLPVPASDSEDEEPSRLSFDDALELTETEDELLPALMEPEPLVLALIELVKLLLPLRLISDEQAEISGSINCDFSIKPVVGMEQS